MIRLADSFSDAVEVAALGKQMHAEGVFGHVPFDTESVLRGATGIIANPKDATLLIAEDHTGIFGFFAATRVPYFFSQTNFMAQELCFYIAPAKRGGLTAARLLAAFEDWGMENNCLEASVGVQAGITDDLAVAFFERFGYARRGTALVKPLVAVLTTES